jgi:hypothetical protein
MKDALDDVDLPPLVRKATQALQEAVKAAIAEHWSRGRPVYIWRDEQVMALYGDGTCIPASEVDKDKK